MSKYYTKNEISVPCPFCEGSLQSINHINEETDPDAGEDTLWAVFCNCGARGPLTPDMEDAIEKWNCNLDGWNRINKYEEPI